MSMLRRACLALLVVCFLDGFRESSAEVFSCVRDPSRYYDVTAWTAGINGTSGELSSAATTGVNCTWTVGGVGRDTKLFNISFSTESATSTFLAVYGAPGYGALVPALGILPFLLPTPPLPPRG